MQDKAARDFSHKPHSSSPDHPLPADEERQVPRTQAKKSSSKPTSIAAVLDKHCSPSQRPDQDDPTSAANAESGFVRMEAGPQQLISCAEIPDASSLATTDADKLLHALWQAKLRSGKVAACADAVMPSSRSTRASRLQAKLQQLTLQIADLQAQIPVV